MSTDTHSINQAPGAPHLFKVWQAAESHCLKCGFCLPVCPTYRETGSEASSPRGRLDLMTAVAKGELALKEIRHQLEFCLGCFACETACPSGIRYRDMFEAGRVDAANAESGKRGRLKRLLLGRILVSPSLLRLVIRGLFVYQRSGLQSLVRASHLLSILAPPLARLESRMPPVPAPFNWRGKELGDDAALNGGKPDAGPEESERSVALFTGCVMDALFGEVHQATVAVLRANGKIVSLPAGQGCCGALHMHQGEQAQARMLAKKNIEAFEANGKQPVLLNSAGCGAHLKDYPALFEGDAEWEARAKHFSERVLDICEYLAELNLVTPSNAVLRKVAYDDPCHLLHAQNVAQPPRQVLAAVPGLQLVSLPESDMCCGSAGSYSLTQPEMSAKLLERKMAHIAATGAEVVATGNPGCLLQLRLGADMHKLPIKIVHPVELLAEAYGGTANGQGTGNRKD